MYAVTNNAITKNLSYILAVSNGGDMVPLDSFSSHDYMLTQATADIVLKSGYSKIVYIETDSITINDIGLTVGITVFTSQTVYYHESNVQAFTTGSS